MHQRGCRPGIVVPRGIFDGTDMCDGVFGRGWGDVAFRPAPLGSGTAVGEDVSDYLLVGPAVETEDMMGNYGGGAAMELREIGNKVCNSSAVCCAPSILVNSGGRFSRRLPSRQCDNDLVLSTHLDASWIEMMKDLVGGIKLELQKLK